jgi:DNA-binding Lrp family transcriptional regulator
MSENINENDKIKMEVPYFQVPNEIFNVEELSIYEKMVYVYLARCGNQGSDVFPSYQTIGDKCGMCRRKAIDCVDKLKELGLIRKENRKVNEKYNKSNLYWIIPPSACHALGSASDTPGSAQYAPNKELCNKEIFKKENNKGVTSKNQEVYSFPEFISIFNQDIKTQVKQAIEYYLMSYEYHIGKKHPKLKYEQWLTVIDKISYVKGKDKKYGNYDIPLIDYKEMIEQHFNTPYKKNRNEECDYKLLHFVSGEDIMKNRYYEIGGDL